MEGKLEGLDNACEGCKCPPQKKAVYLLLALFREVTSLYRSANDSFHPKPVQCQALLAFIQASKVLVSPEVRAFAQALVANRLGPLEVRPGASGAQCVVVELSVHLAAVLLCGNQGLLTPLQQLALLPANMQRAFLPTMPEDMLAVAHKAMGQLQWYFCPNKHPCTIGECGQPMERSRCLDCGLEIGGDNHKAVPGFQAVQIQGDRTQTGHILGEPRRRDNLDMQDTKNMSPVPFNLLRLITHMAMLLGASSHPQEAELRLVKFLPDILALQRDLVKRFQNVTDLTCRTIADFLHSQKAASLTAWYEKRVKIFLTTWNQLRVSLATNGEIKIPGEFCREDLDLTSDFLVLLPRRQGSGLCSTALVSYLIALHNELVYCVDKHTGEETSYTVSPADLSDLHVIRYEPERDLLPLVLSNCQYSVERGQEALHEYDLPKIQQQILCMYRRGNSTSGV
nr:E3 ubiquitin-protein ligase rnf213-alpha-like [Salvelinus alpinus]